MSGPDSIRGINFQHAIALHACLDLLLDDRGREIRVEGSADIVDIEIVDADGHLVLAEQVKSRLTRSWGKRELAGILKRWLAADLGETCVFQLTTDGVLGRSARDFLVSLRGDGTLTPDIFETLDVEVGTSLPELRVRSGLGGVEEQLDSVELRLIKILGLEGPVDPSLATARIDRLFRAVAIASGQSVLSKRVFTREQVADTLEVELAVLDASGDWNDETAQEYVRRIVAAPKDLDVVPLTLRSEHLTPPAIRLVRIGGESAASSQSVEGPIFASALLIAGGLVVGRTGSGKTTLLQQVRSLAAEQGRVAVIVNNETYSSDGLLKAISRSLEEILGYGVRPVAVRTLLSSTSTMLLLDGVSELTPNLRESLSAEIAPFRYGMKSGVIAAGRDVDVLRSVLRSRRDLAGFSPVDLTHEDRCVILRERDPSDVFRIESEKCDAAVTQIETALGVDAGNPLLFGMAASLVLQGRPIGGRASIYEEFLKGFAARTGMSEPEQVFLALGFGWSHLLAEGRRSASRYEWLRLVRDSLRIGTLAGLPNAEAEVVVQAAEDLGLLRRFEPYSPLGPVHDSFADYLSCFAAIRGLAKRATPSNIAQEEELAFYADAMGVDRDFARELATENPLLAVRLCEFESARDSLSELASEATHLLGLLTEDTPDVVGRPGIELHAESQGGFLVIRVARCEASRRSRERAAAPAFLMPLDTGPLAVALRVWGSLVRRLLKGGPQFNTRPRVRSVEEAIDALATHERSVIEETEALLTSAFSEKVTKRLRPAIPNGLRAVVGPPRPSPLYRRRDEFPVVYSRGGGDIEVQYETRSKGQEIFNSGIDRTNQTDVAHVLERPPRREAERRIVETLKLLTHSKWPEELAHSR